jgi:hypothetical protein
MTSLVRGLTWPVVALLIIGSTHLAAEMLRPELRDMISPAVVMPIYLVAGGWAAYATVVGSGSIVLGLAAGAILGILPLALQIVGFGMLLGRGSDVTLTSGLFGLLVIFWGAAIGSGIARARGGQTA